MPNFVIFVPHLGIRGGNGSAPAIASEQLAGCYERCSPQFISTGEFGDAHVKKTQRAESRNLRFSPASLRLVKNLMRIDSWPLRAWLAQFLCLWRRSLLHAQRLDFAVAVVFRRFDALDAATCTGLLLPTGVRRREALGGKDWEVVTRRLDWATSVEHTDRIYEMGPSDFQCSGSLR